MRRRRIAGWAMAAVALALVLVPGTVGSRVPPGATRVAESLLQPVQARDVRAAAAALALDPAHAAAAPFARDAVVVDPGLAPEVVAARPVAAPVVAPGVIAVASWLVDPQISWYGPGFYGNRTACGLAYTETILGVAHKSLPCGTQVTFKHGSRVITVPVIDRGPYVAGRIFDLSAAACKALDHCYTGPIEYRFP